ncbi:interleukin-18 receptor 1-like [Rhincodon typus]|uniref:interleukin-18 receptor 1-like n=1 Tax=Rhincodon typus TaxID=259920 RepID=UPI0009A3F7DC|nr:interleukin-18 receptor 1-like [Rhincodon typus]XP_048453489.1 interleukin-18 receptor 1-like [Rhincodon typus]
MFWIFLLTFAISEMANGCSTKANQIDRCPADVMTTVYALEGEHARLRCRLCVSSTCHAMNDLQTNGSAITWFKDLHGNGSIELVGRTGRFTVEGFLLGFWPATLNDTGRYFCLFFNGTHNIMGENVTLDVTPINEGCYTEELTYERDADIGTSIELLCPQMEEYQNNKEDLKWYKDCQDYIYTGSSLLFNKLKKENAGYYTCTLTLEHSGVQYKTTRTLTLTLKESPAKPNLIYPLEERIEVVLGENRTINCTAFANSTRSLPIQLNWYFNNSPVATCNRAKSVCKSFRRTDIKNNGRYTIRPLVFTQIKEEHLNQIFNCVLTTPNHIVSGYIILQEKGKSNVHGVVKLLTSIVVLVFVAIVCLYFHVQIVLCFRDVTGRDDTLEDGKEYDAYVLLLESKKTLLDTKEEQQFALELLPAILEKQFGYRLCIFERDVPPGGSSADNILSYIKKCRRLIIILCEEYLDNQCSSTYELMTGLYQVLVERKIKPILIEFKPLSSPKLLPESLQLVLKSKRIVKWKGNEPILKNSYFWKKLRYLMPAKGGQRVKHSQHNVVL